MDEEIRQQILTLLDEHRTIATLRPDGWPQAITVGYGNDGLTLYFLCGLESQKAANLARDDRVSLTIDHDTPQVMDITGLSMAARATVVVDPAEGEKALRLLMRKYPPQDSLPLPMPTAADVRIFRVTPTVIAVLDYSIRPTFMIISGWRDPPGTHHGSYTHICERRPNIMAEDIAGEGAAAAPPPDTLAALLTAALSAKLADAVSELVGAAYAARILRIEPKVHGGAEILVAFDPLPPDHTLRIALGEEMVEIPLPPGVVDKPTA